MPLAISRDVGETVKIGDDIYVTVKSADRGRARLVIAAPDEIPIHRLELQAARDHSENKKET